MKIFEFYKKHNFLFVPLFPGKKNPAAKAGQSWKDLIVPFEELESTKHIGLVTGKESGVTVVDIDTRPLPEELKSLVDSGPFQKTGKGYHFLYLYDKEILQTQDPILHIDIRNDGGQIVVAPTKVDTDKVLRKWFNLDKPIGKIKPEFKEWLLKNRTPVKEEFKDLLDYDPKLSPFKKGERHTSFMLLGGKLRKILNARQLSYAMRVLGSHCFSPPLEEKDLGPRIKDLTSYTKQDTEGLQGRVKNYLNMVQEGTVRDIQESLGEPKVEIEEVLRALLDKQELIKKSRLYSVVEQVEWEHSLDMTEINVPYKIPYFDGYMPFAWQDTILLGTPTGCVDKDTEYLSTNGGWRSISEWRGEPVGQYTPDGELEFVHPNEYLRFPAKELNLITNKSINQVVCDEHDLVYFTNATKGKPKKIKISDVKLKHKELVTGFRGFIETTFKYNGAGLDISEGELRLQVAVIADGRIVREGKKNYTQMRFGKKRKYKRLLKLCKKYNLEYKDKGEKESNKYKSGYKYEVIVFPKWRDKDFNSKYYRCSKKQLEIIADEVLHWDGTFSGNPRFTSTKKSSVDFIQFTFSALGKRASITEDTRSSKYTKDYCGTVGISLSTGNRVSIRKTKNSTTSIKPFKTKDGFKYCFQVPSGMLILRRENKIFVTGNCGKTTIAINMIKKFVEQGVHPYYLCTESGARYKKKATKLGLKEGDFSYKEVQYPEQVEFEEKSLVIIDWIDFEDYAKANSTMKQLQAKAIEKKCLLIIFVQLREPAKEGAFPSWFAKDLVKHYCSLAARYVREDNESGFWMVDKVRDAEEYKNNRVPCFFDFDTGRHYEV